MLNHIKQYDTVLLTLFFTLASVGCVIMFSASIDFSDHKHGSPFYYFQRQMIFWVVALISGCIVIKIPLRMWSKFSGLFLMLGFGLLVLISIPGIGKVVNGSRRWLDLGFVNIQGAEIAKLGLLIYLADYLTRRQIELRTELMGMLKPMIVLIFMIVLLLMAPDFGSVVVLSTAALGMLFLAGVKFWQFVTFMVACLMAVFVMAISSPYRLKRLSCFMDPWEQPWECGYQLTQSLIAIGRGEWFGAGLGNSVQKLFYLPESHTDFVFAILAEETGFIGGAIVILLFVVLFCRILYVARQAELAKQFFGAYLAYGIAIVLSFQAYINIGVNTGLLPTKGLTLPFISYGGSSLLVCTVFIFLILRIDYETRNMEILKPRKQTRKKTRKQKNPKQKVSRVFTV
jgi:cell division protein FtsW